MSCSLTYDDVLSRVRITADNLCVTGTGVVADTFTRTVTGGWGTADTGQTWTTSGGVVSDYAVGSGVGTQTATTENVLRATLLDIGTGDIDYYVTVSSNKLAAGADQVAQLLGRRTNAGNFYFAQLTFTTAQDVTLDLNKRVSSVDTNIGAAVTLATGTHAINQQWTVRLHVYGTNIKVKAWLTSTSEPVTWTHEVTDTSLSSGNIISVRNILGTGTSNEPVVFSFDNLAESRATAYATVDRTTNNVNYTIVRGATEVPITTGCELARTVDDYEFPVGQEITYRVRSFTEGGVELTESECLITVDLDQVWIKSIGRPFLNRPVDCVLNPSPITRPARNGVFDIVGRSYPVAVTDVRGSRRVTVRVVTRTTQERTDMDLLLMSGDPVYYQTPLNHPLPTMYAVIDDTTESRPLLNRRCNDDWRLYELPSIEVAAPTADVVGATSTWQTVVTTYATWADVIAANDTWADVLDLVGDGSEVIVP